MDFKVDESKLEAALAKVEQVRSWSPRVISKLENYIRTAGDEELFRISPLHWAAEKSVDEHEAIDLFLYSTKSGLFMMEWNVICPCCGQITHSLRDLHSVEAESTCKLCFRKDKPTLDDAVQVGFTIVPSIRSIRFHHPEDLSLEDYCFKYLFQPNTIVSGMLPIMDAFEYLKRHFSEFSPGEKITVETEIGVGIVANMNILGQQSFGLIASGEPASEVQRLAVKLTDTGFEVPLPEMQPGEFSLGPLEYAGSFFAIQPGKVVLEFEQATRRKAALVVTFSPLPLDGGGITMEMPDNLSAEAMAEIEKMVASVGSMDGGMMIPPSHTYSSPRLTAKRLFTCQTFHDLFRAEVFQESAGFGIKDSTFLFTDLKSSTQLYQEIGDLNAFALVREHYGVLNNAIINHHGAAVKTIGDAIMATFDRPADAVAAGLEMLREMRKMNEESHQDDLILKIGIHRGAAISVTLNERIDYFGQTVNIAARVQGIAGGDEIYMSDEIYNAPGVAELLQKNQSSVESIQAQLKGIEEDMRLYKTTAAA